MFGTRKNSMAVTSTLEQLINRATDGNITSDNWQYILEVCDNISSNPEVATKEAISIISGRLALKDANVILRTLSLLVAIAENCGSRMRQEIASKSFLNDYLIKKLKDKKLHRTVKLRIAEVIEQLHNSFKLDPSLKPMTDTYNKIRAEYPQYIKGAVSGPDKPAKQEMTQQDKIKEEEDLQRVLKLSLQEFERESSVKKSYKNKPLPDMQHQQKQQQQHQQPDRVQNKSPEQETIATVSKVRALYDLISYEPDELSFRKGDVITVIESVYRDWWRGTLASGRTGIFPLNYVTPIVNLSPQELAREAESENKVLTIDARKVDRLLALLSFNPENAEDEITQLYNEVIPVRPQLGKFIDRYNVRKEELLVLNSQLNNEVKVYNDLMDKLISLRAHTHQNNPLVPYPTAAPSYNQPLEYAQSLNYGYESSHLIQQATSSGFGNAPPKASVPPNSQHQNQPQNYNTQPLAYSQVQNSQNPQNQQRPMAYPQHSQALYPSQNLNQSFLNINKFPEVNNMQ